MSTKKCCFCGSNEHDTAYCPLRGQTTPPAAQVQGEQPVVVGQLALDEPFDGTEGLEIGEWEFVPERAVVESMLAVSTGEIVPLMTVAQHERIVAALSAPPAAVDQTLLEGDPFHSDDDDLAALLSSAVGLLKVGANQDSAELFMRDMKRVEERLAAPPAAGVPEAEHEALLKRLAEAQDVLAGVKRYTENNGYRLVEVERFLAGVIPARPGKDPVTLFGEICHVLAVLGAPENVMEQVSAAAEGDPIPEVSLFPFVAPTAPTELSQVERKALVGLIELASAAFHVADSAADDGSEAINVPRWEMSELERCLDALEELPDDQPGYTLGPSGRAEWALRRFFGGMTIMGQENSTPPASEQQQAVFAIPDMDEHLLEILGRPNFRCSHIAQVLRLGGAEIKRKSEHEQAAVIHWMLTLYLAHGAAWWEVATDEIKRIQSEQPAAPSQGGDA